LEPQMSEMMALRQAREGSARNVGGCVNAVLWGASP
jgi:hypothetical protein